MARHGKSQPLWERPVFATVLVTLLGGAGWLITHQVVPWLSPSDLQLELTTSQLPEIPLVEGEKPSLGGDVVYCQALTTNVVAAHNKRGEADIRITQIAIEVQPEHRPLKGSCDVDVLKLHPRGKAVAVRGYTFNVGTGGRIDARYVISEVETGGGGLASAAPVGGIEVDPADIFHWLNSPGRPEGVDVTNKEPNYQISGRVVTTGPGLYRVRFHAKYIVAGREGVRERSTKWVYVDGPRG